MRTSSWLVIAVLVMGGVSFLAIPADLSAAGTVEVDTNYYTCPDEATSLSECTWDGEYFNP